MQMPPLKRYDLTGIFAESKSMREMDDGHYVTHTDYQKLQEQLEKAEAALKKYSDRSNWCEYDDKYAQGEFSRIRDFDLDKGNPFQDKYGGYCARQYFKEKESK